MDKDGTKLVAVAGASYIYTSDNLGFSWTQQTAAGRRAWRSLDASFDFSVIAAAVDEGYVYVSTDGGASVTEQQGAGDGYWYSIACSYACDKLVVVDNALNSDVGGYIYTSANTGARPWPASQHGHAALAMPISWAMHSALPLQLSSWACSFPHHLSSLAAPIGCPLLPSRFCHLTAPPLPGPMPCRLQLEQPHRRRCMALVCGGL